MSFSALRPKFSILFIAIIAIFTLFGFDQASAHNGYTHGSLPVGRSWNNSAESNAWWQCSYGAGTTHNVRGAIWFTSNASSYYSLGVNVSNGQTTVPVYIRGSAYSCGVNANTLTIYAINIAPQGSNGYRLTGLDSTVLSRGKFPNGLNRWTSQGSSVGADLNVAGLATNNATSDDTQTINIDLYRCFSLNGTRIGGSCYAESVPITVTRKKKPAQPIVWTIDGQSRVGRTAVQKSAGTIVAFPGDQVRWYHTLENNGPSNMATNVSYSTKRTGFGNGWNTSTTPSGTARGNANVVFVNQNAPAATNSVYTVLGSDIGRNLCASIGWTPGSTASAVALSSTPACADIRSDYDIYPNAQFGGQKTAVLPVGSTTTANEEIFNDGATSDTTSAFQAYQFKVPSGTAINFATVFNQNASGYIFKVADYAAAGNACTDWLRVQATFVGKVICENQTTSGLRTFPSGVTNLNDATVIDANNYIAGDRVCRIVVANHYNFATSANATSRRVSYPACVTIAKKPFVKIEGNDLRVGSALSAVANINTAKVGGNTAVIDGNQRGSWVEYGIFAPSTVTSMASGSRFAADGVAASQSDWSKLTFANDSTYGQYASGGALGIIPNVRTYFANTTLPAYLTRSNTANATIGAYAPNTVILDSGTVTISSNINAPNGPITTGEAGISQMLIIATGNIRIAPGVQNIDAWLIAPNGTIETCNGVADPLTTTVCDKQLTITGPVMASHLKLRRTYGVKNEYAESINLRADAYIWARHLSTQTGSWQTKYTTELPPRY